ncbi:CaiB/BaiF CoA transferase family protein [Microvirga splendida]|uniref:CoA transferase n=1 Tax=Microvirga splendida TaxID=2795727 RepID=A0ABS0Y708_9HYPH|nr:CoA transferase [Microvirga splendida]MBJ6128094.1 CoA transferase [Microvirga splendida]
MAAPRPLTGKRVIELAQFIAGPTAAQLLADFGAEVIKIEAPTGDGSRGLPGTAFGSVYTRSFNTSKASTVIDTRQEADRARLGELLASADALVCNLAPGALRRLDLDAASIRRRFPKLVATLISGYGQQDERTCMDTIAQCESGFAWLNGAEDGSPRLSTSWPADFFSGFYAALSTAMALAEPDRAEGCIIDISMMEIAAAMLLGPAALLVAEGGQPAPGTGNRDRASAPSGVYPCQDGQIYIYGGLDPYWAKLKPLVGGRDAPITERIACAQEFDERVGAWTAQRTCEAALAVMNELGIPAGAVRDPVSAVEMIRSLRQGAVSRGLGSGEHVPSFPALFDGERIARSPAPPLGGTRQAE